MCAGGWGVAEVSCSSHAHTWAEHSAIAVARSTALPLKLPVIGDIMHKSAVSRFTRTLATTFASGVPLIEGLETAAGAADNRVYIKAINEVRQDVCMKRVFGSAMPPAPRQRRR